MLVFPELLLEQGIRLRDYCQGNHKLPCPRCSHTRKKRTDPCLSLTIERDRAVWHCHHCDWSGAVGERDDYRTQQRRRVGSVKPKATPGNPTPALLQWFAKRGISAATVERNQIWEVRNYIPALGTTVDCIAFPYFRDGELINIKFRALEEKAFAQVKHAEKIFFGLDDIAGAEGAVIVEGEPDKMACEVAGFRNVVSVPEGAPAKLRDEPNVDDAKFEYRNNCAEELERIKGKFIIAVDNDDNGKVLEEELARRLGKERCWRVRWPNSGDAPCKDANETLLRHGADVLRECIELAEPYPIAGLHSALDFADETLVLYLGGHERGLSTGWAAPMNT